MGRIKRTLRAATIAVVLAGIGGSSTPAQAGIPVFDWAAIIQRVSQLLSHLGQWSKQISKMRETYALGYAAYQGVKNWKDLGWVDALRLTEMPFFDGVAGIDDLRDLAAVTEMTVEELQTMFAEIEMIKRMMDDPMYAQNAAFQARVRLMSRMHSRQMKRRMVFAKQYKGLQLERKRLENQLKIIQSQIEGMSSMNPAPIAAIAALQNKVQIIQTKLTGAIATMEAQAKLAKEQEAAEIHQTASKAEVEKKKAEADFWKAMGGFWDAYLEKKG